MALRQHPEAELEYGHTIAWYEADYEGRGVRFFDAVESMFARIRAEGAPVPAVAAHHVSVRRGAALSYQVIFREEQEDVIVYAVAHNKQRPGYWQGRAR